jgi:hypothetical protein
MPNQDRYCVVCGFAGSYLDFDPPDEGMTKQRCQRCPGEGCGATVAWLEDDDEPPRRSG